jgi:hypothetical protein
MSNLACLNDNGVGLSDALPWREMAGKKDLDATKNLPEGEPTQVTPKGQKIGLPKRREVFEALEKTIKKTPK